jgi:hypothetical protein
VNEGMNAHAGDHGRDSPLAIDPRAIQLLRVSIYIYIYDYLYLGSPLSFCV